MVVVGRGPFTDKNDSTFCRVGFCWTFTSYGRRCNFRVCHWKDWYSFEKDYT